MRIFRSADLEAVYRLIRTTIESSYVSVYPPRAVQFFKDHHTRDRLLERHAKGEVVVVERDGDLVATGAIVGDHIMAVFVRPQDQRHGLGRRVMNALEDCARAAGRPSAHIDVSLTSRRFYESRGYERMEGCSIDVGEGQRLDYWTAQKDLREGSRLNARTAGVLEYPPGESSSCR